MAWLEPEDLAFPDWARPGTGGRTRHINQYPEVTSAPRLCVANLGK